MELVYREVIGKQKELLVDTVRGVLGPRVYQCLMIDFYDIQNKQICCIYYFILLGLASHCFAKLCHLISSGYINRIFAEMGGIVWRV